MSLKTLLAKIGEEVTSIFSKTVNELETVILPAATNVTNVLKSITDYDPNDIIGKLVAGSGGAIAEDKLRQVLAIVVPKLQLAQQFLSTETDPSVILANIIKLVGVSAPVTQSAFWIEFSGLLAQDLAGGITVAEAYTLEQYFFKNYPAAA